MQSGSRRASKLARGWLLLDVEGIGNQLCEGLSLGGGCGSLLGGLDTPVSKTDVRALGKVRRWECVCSGDFTRPCPFHAIVNQLEILRSSHGGEGSSPLFPTLSGGFVDKRHVVTSIEFVASLIGEALTGSGGVRRFGGQSLRVTGARLMAGMGISIVLIQLMARWSSEVVCDMSLKPLYKECLALTGEDCLHLHWDVCRGGVEAARGFQVGGGAG